MYPGPKAGSAPEACRKASAGIVALAAAQAQQGFKFEWLLPKHADQQLAVGYGLEEREDKPTAVSPLFNKPVSIIWLPCPRGFHATSPGRAVGAQGIRTTTTAPLGPSGPSQLCSKQQPKPVRSTQVFTTAALAVLHFSLKYTLHFLRQN